MKHYCLFAGLLAATFLLTGSNAEAGPVPKLINYQGKLVQADGTNPLGSGVYQLRFELFDAAVAGTLVWGETQQVAVAGGIFNVILGAAGAVPVAGAAVNDLGFAFGSADRFLQTTIISGPGGAINQTLAPRQQMMSVPFAVEAQKALRADVAASAENLPAQLMQALNPSGTVIIYAGVITDNNIIQEPIPGYLLCNGAVFDPRVQDGKYSALKLAIQESWGNGGDAEGPMANLPDLRGVFLRGVSGMANDGFVDPDRESASSRVARNAGGNTGPSVGSFQMDAFASHSHPGSSISYRGWNNVDAGSNRQVKSRAELPQDPFEYGGSLYIAPEGGSVETRGKNANVFYLIKY